MTERKEKNEFNDALLAFRIIAPAFEDIPDKDTVYGGGIMYGVLTYMRIFAPLISRKKFGRLYPQALAYLTAHKLALQGLSSDSDDESDLTSITNALRLSSASEGETSVSFSNNTLTSETDGEYALTVYGVQFLAIRKSVVASITSAGFEVPKKKDGRCVCCGDLCDGRRDNRRR